MSTPTPSPCPPEKLTQWLVLYRTTANPAQWQSDVVVARSSGRAGDAVERSTRRYLLLEMRVVKMDHVLADPLFNPDVPRVLAADARRRVQQ